MRRNQVIFELFVLFIMLPLAVSNTSMPFQLVFLPMFAIFIYAVLWLFFYKKILFKKLWRSDSPAAEKQQLKLILFRFAISSVLLLALILLAYPDDFLNFPRQYPLFFLLFMVLYPVLSVLPQELIYRTFFFQRYTLIFDSQRSIVIASTLVFSFLHIIFHNYIAVLLTLIGGYFFSQTYCKTRSLFLACVEHSLYGLLVFTLGFGGFFIRGLREAGLAL